MIPLTKTVTFSSQSRQADRSRLNFPYLLSQTRFFNYPIDPHRAMDYTFRTARGSTFTPGPMTVESAILLI